MGTLKDRSLEALVEGIARIASGLLRPEDFDTRLAPRVAVEAARNVGLQLRWVRGGGLLYCPLCGRGPFQPRGYYLHLLRVHYPQLVHLLQEEVERLVDASRG